MQSLVICSATADSAAADQIRRYLELNCPNISIEGNAIAEPATGLLDAIERALSADIAVLLISPDVVPAGWSRSQWEPVLVQQPRELGTELAFAMLRPCRFPEVLRKQHFFDFSTNWRDGMRKLRSWLLEQNPLKQERANLLPVWTDSAAVDSDVITQIEDQIGNQPGVMSDVPRAAALAYAEAHSLDFEGVFWIDCFGRSRAGIIGDTAHALGLKLTGPEEENSAALREFCGGHRNLYVFDQMLHKYRELMSFGAWASVIFTQQSEAQRKTLTLAETVELFAEWRNKPALCLRHLGDACLHLGVLETDCTEETAVLAKEAGADAFNLLQHYERVAEAYEFAEVLSRRAWSDGDRVALERWELEKRWILQSWGFAPPVSIRLGGFDPPTQMTLGF